MEPDNSPKEIQINSESLTDRPDGWLLREWKAGDERAAEILFDRYAIRLVALVASSLNRSYQGSIDPNDVVQSAMGSFFNAARHSRIEVSRSVSLWRLLATFARRKMARSIERQSAVKRGGDQVRHSLDSVQSQTTSEHGLDQNDEANEFITTLKAELPDDLFVIIEGILAGQTHRELAESLGIDERTVRRGLSRVRELLAPNAATAEETAHAANSPPTLPRVNYNEFVLGKLIGSGGFGKVYRASMQADGGTVAVKFLRKVFWQNEAARGSFLSEINLTSQIKHPGIIRYLSYGESPHGDRMSSASGLTGNRCERLPTLRRIRSSIGSGKSAMPSRPCIMPDLSTVTSRRATFWSMRTLESQSPTSGFHKHQRFHHRKSWEEHQASRLPSKSTQRSARSAPRPTSTRLAVSFTGSSVGGHPTPAQVSMNRCRQRSRVAIQKSRQTKRIPPCFATFSQSRSANRPRTEPQPSKTSWQCLVDQDELGKRILPW